MILLYLLFFFFFALFNLFIVFVLTRKTTAHTLNLLRSPLNDMPFCGSLTTADSHVSGLDLCAAAVVRCSFINVWSRRYVVTPFLLKGFKQCLKSYLFTSAVAISDTSFLRLCAVPFSSRWHFLHHFPAAQFSFFWKGLYFTVIFWKIFSLALEA